MADTETREALAKRLTDEARIFAGRDYPGTAALMREAAALLAERGATTREPDGHQAERFRIANGLTLNLNDAIDHNSDGRVRVALTFDDAREIIDALREAPQEATGTAQTATASRTAGTQVGEEQGRWLAFNLNAALRVRLNDKGRAIWREYFKDAAYSRNKCWGEWTEMQAWEFTNIFGPHLGLGFDNPCDMTIQIQRPAVAEGSPSGTSDSRKRTPSSRR